MIHSSIPVTLFALAAPAGAMLADTRAPLDGVVLAQLSIHQRVIIRVPRMPPQPMRALPRAADPIELKEHKGPKCVAGSSIAGAMLSKPGSVDLMMMDGTRLRAKLDGDCAPLDYYRGFYIRPAGDGLLCRDRDVLRMRSGASCEIDDFKTLRAKRK